MRIFISGGCKNGKSYQAQRLAKKQQQGDLYYVATMKPGDAEDRERICRHQKDRSGWGFHTVEQFTDIDDILNRCDPKGSFLLDSTTALLANEMFTAGGMREDAADKVEKDLSRLLQRVENLVMVSDYIFSDAGIYDDAVECYRRGLAQLDRVLAAQSDIVIEVVSSGTVVHKGQNYYKHLHRELTTWDKGGSL